MPLHHSCWDDQCFCLPISQLSSSIVYVTYIYAHALVRASSEVCHEIVSRVKLGKSIQVTRRAFGTPLESFWKKDKSWKSINCILTVLCGRKVEVIIIVEATVEGAGWTFLFFYIKVQLAISLDLPYLITSWTTHLAGWIHLLRSQVGPGLNIMPNTDVSA